VRTGIVAWILQVSFAGMGRQSSSATVNRRLITMTGIRTVSTLIAGLAIGFSATIGLVGCGETTENKTKIEQSGPGGTTTQESIDKVKQTGNNPPPPTEVPK
jgi:hypothetical protein